MSRVIEIHLEWKYTPENFVEAPIQISDKGFHLLISDGMALAKVDPAFFEANPDTKETLTSLIEHRLRAVQIMSHRSYTLSKPSRTDLREDGKKNRFVEAHILGSSCSMTGSPVDFIVKDVDGQIIADSKRDRLDRQKWIAEVSDKYRGSDSTLDQIFNSYQKAVNDPEDELVHLYEIRDALKTKFGKGHKARKALGITEKEWKEIGRLADSEPLKEGRHRGNFAGKLRPAEKHELEEARKSALNIIERYLIYLER